MSESATRHQGYRQVLWYAMPLVALAVYVGAYFALVDRSKSAGLPILSGGKVFFSEEHYAVTYHIDHPALEPVFRPIHWIDLIVRADHWKTPRTSYWEYRKSPL